MAQDAALKGRRYQGNGKKQKGARLSRRDASYLVLWFRCLCAGFLVDWPSS